MRSPTGECLGVFKARNSRVTGRPRLSASSVIVDRTTGFFLQVHPNRFIGPGVNLFPWTIIGAVVPFELASDLLEPESTWLHAARFDVFGEVPILRHRADVVGLRGEGVTAIEMKLYKWDQALRHANADQHTSDT